MKFEIDTDKIIDNVVSEVLEKKIDGKTFKQWMVEIAKHQWISVKDQLPEKDGDYLIRLKNGAMMVIYYKFDYKNPGWYEYDSEWGFCERNDVTHYMPLPEPPKED